MPQPRIRRAFALAEAAAVVLVVAVIAAALLICATDSRRLARLGQDVDQLRRIGAATGAYFADNEDLFWTFTWQRNRVYQTQYPELNNAGTNLQAAANQLVYILRTKGNRPDMPFLPNIIPHITYSHVVLADYSQQRFPWTTPISAADTYRAKWANDPACFDQGCFLPLQPDPSVTPANKRWPYSSSFMPTMAYFDLSPVGSRLQNSGSSNTYLVYPDAVFGPVVLSTVRHPSQKVMLHDQFARHFGPRQPYCTHPQARLPLLMSEGSVAVRSAADSNRGWSPNSPTQNTPLAYSYDNNGRLWDPPAVSGSSDLVQGAFRYTRNGVQGWDYGRPEVFP